MNGCIDMRNDIHHAHIFTTCMKQYVFTIVVLKRLIVVVRFDHFGRSLAIHYLDNSLLNTSATLEKVLGWRRIFAKDLCVRNQHTGLQHTGDKSTQKAYDTTWKLWPERLSWHRLPLLVNSF